MPRATVIQPQQVIQRHPPRPLRQYHQQRRGPKPMGDPSLWKHEDLDHGCHAQQPQRANPRKQAKHQQDRQQMFGHCRKLGGDCGGIRGRA